jgi:hypothetical protein
VPAGRNHYAKYDEWDRTSVHRAGSELLFHAGDRIPGKSRQRARSALGRLICGQSLG